MFIQYEKHSPDALGSFLTDVPLTSPAYLVFSYWGTHNSSLTYAWAGCLQFSSIIFLGKISPYLNKREEGDVSVGSVSLSEDFSSRLQLLLL